MLRLALTSVKVPIELQRMSFSEVLAIPMSVMELALYAEIREFYGIKEATALVLQTRKVGE